MAGVGNELGASQRGQVCFQRDYVCLGSCLHGDVFYAPHDSEFSRKSIFPSVFVPSTIISYCLWGGCLTILKIKKIKKGRILKEELKSPYNTSEQRQKIGVWWWRRKAIRMKCPGIKGNTFPLRTPRESESADWAEMYFLRKVSVPSLPSLSSGREGQGLTTCEGICSKKIQIYLIRTLIFPIWYFGSRVGIIYTPCCSENHLILTQNIAFLIAKEEIIKCK